MKKMLICVLVLSLAIVFVGCNGDDKKEWTSFTEPLGTSLVEEVPFDDEMVAIDMNLISTMYGIDNTNLVDYKVYMASGGTADEIAIFFAKDEEKAAELKEVVNTRVQDQIKVMENYLPDEVSKLENALIYSEGPYVVLCVSGDTEKAKEIVNSYFTK